LFSQHTSRKNTDSYLANILDFKQKEIKTKFTIPNLLIHPIPENSFACSMTVNEMDKMTLKPNWFARTYHFLKDFLSV
jgi:hypothetical protein